MNKKISVSFAITPSKYRKALKSSSRADMNFSVFVCHALDEFISQINFTNEPMTLEEARKIFLTRSEYEDCLKELEENYKKQYQYDLPRVDDENLRR